MSTPWQTPPARQRPPLTKRLQPRHWVALDYIAALPCALVIFLNEPQLAPYYHAAWPGLSRVVVTAAIAVAASLPVALRRRNPIAALVASTAYAAAAPLIATAVAATPALTRFPPTVPPAAGSGFQFASVYFLPTAYVIYLVAAQSRRAVSAAALGAVLFPLVIEAMLTLMRGGLNKRPEVLAALVVIIFWMVGYAAGQRRAYATQLQHQAAAGAVTEERLRIARELHDVVAHSMTVIAVQAGYGHHVIDRQPGKAQEALAAIAATSRESLAEMRRMLGVLRQPGPAAFGNSQSLISLDSGGRNGPSGRANGAAGIAAPGPAPGPAAPLAPAPGLGDLDRLVARIGNAGVAVDVRVDGIRRELPQGIDLAAFRIVQEALTNVVKHADTPRCTVTIGYHEDELSIEVADDGRGCPGPAAGGPGAGSGEPGVEPAGGHGLIGMRERVSLYAGELTAQPLPGRGFRVAARLPVGGGAL